MADVTALGQSACLSLLKTGKRKKNKTNKLILKKEAKKISTETALDRWNGPEGDTDWPVKMKQKANP